jgi:hypothetical protein
MAKPKSRCIGCGRVIYYNEGSAGHSSKEGDWATAKWSQDTHSYYACPIRWKDRESYMYEPSNQHYPMDILSYLASELSGGSPVKSSSSST